MTFSYSTRPAVAALMTGALLALPDAAPQVPAVASIIELVVARNDPPPTQYRALRRLAAKSQHFGASAWMEAWTEVDPEGGFRFTVIGEGGSGYVRSHVLRPWLEREDKMWAAGDPGRAALTFENYEFVDRGLNTEGLAWLGVKPRHKDVLLVDGSIYVNPDDGDLVRIEGRLSKAPSFWTRRVEIVRHYERINGVRVPTAIESTAQVLIAGRSTFSMKYEYETINGVRVGNPEPTVKGGTGLGRGQVSVLGDGSLQCTGTETRPHGDLSPYICRSAIAKSRNPTAPRQ